MSIEMPVDHATPSRVERWGAIVIGAGRAGIALGRLLLERDVDFLILDRIVAGGPERIAMRFDLPLRMGSDVTALRWNGTHYVLHSLALSYESRHVIVATGACTLNWSWIHLALPVENGVPCTVRGIVPTLPGLYFAGRRFQPEFDEPLGSKDDVRDLFITECIASEDE